MVGLQPNVADGARYTQKETAAILEISYKTVRNYETQGIMPAGRRIRKYTYYYGRDIKRCWRNYFDSF